MVRNGMYKAAITIASFTGAGHMPFPGQSTNRNVLSTPHWNHIFPVGYQPGLVLWSGEPKLNLIKSPDKLMRRIDQTHSIQVCSSTVGKPRPVTS